MNGLDECVACVKCFVFGASILIALKMAVEYPVLIVMVLIARVFWRAGF